MSTSTFSTGDLRKNAIDYQRDQVKKHKWAHGESFGPGRRVEDGHPRPARFLSEHRGIRPDGIHASTFKARARSNVKVDISDCMGSDSDDHVEDIEEASAAPAPDADITYSFDAARGPSHGSQVLGHALAKAIERYEVRVTDKLIKDEYEVLDKEGQPIFNGKGKKPVRVNDADEDFELV